MVKTTVLPHSDADIAAIRAQVAEHQAAIKALEIKLSEMHHENDKVTRAAEQKAASKFSTAKQTILNKLTVEGSYIRRTFKVRGSGHTNKVFNPNQEHYQWVTINDGTVDSLIAAKFVEYMRDLKEYGVSGYRITELGKQTLEQWNQKGK